MYHKSFTTAEAADLLEHMYGHHYTPPTISNMTQTMEAEGEAFEAGRWQALSLYLFERYVYRVKTGCSSQRSSDNAIGSQESGSEEILAYLLASPTETTGNWQELLEDL